MDTAPANDQITAEQAAKLAQDILRRLKKNERKVCIADLRDLRKIAGEGK